MEKQILDSIITKLNSEGSGVKGKAIKSAINLTKYKPANEDEILVKSLGFSNARYIDSQGNNDTLRFGNFVIREYKFRLILVNKSMKSQDDVLEQTEAIEEAVLSITNTIEEDDKEEGVFYLQSINEPMFEENKNFHFREMIFVKLIHQYIG